MSNLFDLSGKTALVTGGTKGIGRAVVERMIEHGARVAFTSRSADDCKAFAAELNKKARREVALGLASDSSNLEQMAATVDQVEKDFGAIDTLVINAAVLAFIGNSADTPEDFFKQGLQTNIYNHFRLCHQVAQGMKARRDGSIIFITSGAAFEYIPSVLSYAVSKAGETHLANCLAAELAPFNVRVNCVAPGLTRTPSSRNVWENKEILAAATKGIPLGRMGEPDEVAAGVIFLAAPGGAWTTGVTLRIDGGPFPSVGMPLPPGMS